MKELSYEEMLYILCIPEAVDEPEESDFVPQSVVEEKLDELSVRNWIAKEMES